MNSADIVISSDAIIRISVILLYVPIGLISVRLLIPRLSPSAKRLALGMLAAQALVIVLALESRPTAAFDRWLWDFHEEWNIQAMLASAQLAAVGGVALLIAWLGRSRPIWQRLYFAGTGLVFIFLGLDEYLALHEFIQDWELRYIALGRCRGLGDLGCGLAIRAPRSYLASLSPGRPRRQRDRRHALQRHPGNLR